MQQHLVIPSLSSELQSPSCYMSLLCTHPMNTWMLCADADKVLFQKSLFGEVAHDTDGMCVA